MTFETKSQKEMREALEEVLDDMAFNEIEFVGYDDGLQRLIVIWGDEIEEEEEE